MARKYCTGWPGARGTGLALIATGATLAFRTRATEPPIDRALRPTWRIRPLDQLAPGRMDGATRVWMLVLRGYLLVAVGRGGARRATGAGAVERWGSRVLGQ